MDDEFLVKKYILILDSIINGALLSLSSKVGKDEIENSLEIWNSSNFELENFEFVLFFHNIPQITKCIKPHNLIQYNGSQMATIVLIV